MLSLLLWFGAAVADAGQVLLRRSPLAGSQFYRLALLHGQIQVGDELQLVREPDNPHDAQAIRVEWRGQPLGHVPRAHNAPLAAALDAGQGLKARIVQLADDPDPWRRLEFEVWLPL